MNRVRLSSCVSLQSVFNRNLSSITKEYKFIQKSSLPSLHFQKSLPRLPIPALEKSCQRYLRAQRPLLNDDEYDAVENHVKKFSTHEGPALQKELIEIDRENRHTSYISKPWSDMYLSDRRPLPINYNPFLVFINDPKKQYNEQLVRATNLVVSSLRFLNSLRANLIEPEVYHLNPKKSDTKFFRTVTGALPSSISWYGAYLFKAFPLDMSQYVNLFNTSRIPKRGIDQLYHIEKSNYIIVMKGGRFFKLRVFDDSDNIIDAPVIMSCLEAIMNKSSNDTLPVGILTTEDRDTWADARQHLENIGNSEVLSTIDGAIFNLVLDENELTELDYPGIIREYLHSNGKNRWFDKSFSLIINKSGIAGVNFEHSWGDGIAVLRYFQDIYKDSTENPQVHPNARANNQENVDTLFNELVFQLDDSSKSSIEKAFMKYNETTSSLGIEVHEFKQFGRNLCKKHSLSPDFLMQLSFQMAHYKLNNYFVSTYESCSTSAFKHGRTETMRPLTVEAKELCLEFSNKARRSNDELIKLMKTASDVHGSLIKDAAMGQGFDRHLFALRLLAEKKSSVPEIFTHPSYKKLNHYILSTSTLASDVVMLGAFGPVVPDGFGIGYSIWNERLGAIVSNYKGNTDGAGLISCWQDSLNILHGLLK